MKHRWGLYYKSITDQFDSSSSESHGIPGFHHQKNDSRFTTKSRMGSFSSVGTSLSGVATASLVGLADVRPVHISGVKLHVTFHGFVADVHCSAVFLNRTDAIINTFFLFPTGPHSAVYRFEASTGSRLVKGVCREKSKINIDDFMDPVLVEEGPSGLFSCSVGAVPAGGRVEILFHYVQELSVSSDNLLLKFCFPSFIPRKLQQSGYAEVENMSQWTTNSFNIPSEAFVFEFNALVAGSYLIKEVYSGLVLLKTTYLDNSKCNAKIHLMGDVDLCQDFTFSIEYANVFFPRAVIEKGSHQIGDHNAMANDLATLTFFHRSLNHLSLSRVMEYVFLIDISGSMKGPKIEKAKEALLVCLESLPLGCIFNVINFGATVEPLFSQSKAYAKYNVERAIRYQRKLQADRMRANLLPALKFVYGIPLRKDHSQRPKQVFLLTDGAITSTEKVLEYVKLHSRDSRLFIFGFGDDAFRFFLTSLAKAGNGKAHFLHTTERPHRKVQTALEEAMQPGLVRLKLDVQLPAGIRGTFLPPKLVPQLFAEQKLTLHLLLQGKPAARGKTECSVVLHGRVCGKETSQTVMFDLKETVCNDNLPAHRLALKRDMDQLETDVDRALGVEDVLENEFHLLEASLASNVASRYTTCVAVDSISEQIIPEAGVLSVRPEDNPYHISKAGSRVYLPGTRIGSLSLTPSRYGHGRDSHSSIISSPSGSSLLYKGLFGKGKTVLRERKGKRSIDEQGKPLSTQAYSTVTSSMKDAEVVSKSRIEMGNAVLAESDNFSLIDARSVESLKQDFRRVRSTFSEHSRAVQRHQHQDKSKLQLEQKYLYQPKQLYCQQFQQEERQRYAGAAGHHQPVGYGNGSGSSWSEAGDAYSESKLYRELTSSSDDSTHGDSDIDRVSIGYDREGPMEHDIYNITETPKQEVSSAVVNTPVHSSYWTSSQSCLAQYDVSQTGSDLPIDMHSSQLDDPTVTETVTETRNVFLNPDGTNIDRLYCVNSSHGEHIPLPSKPLNPKSRKGLLRRMFSLWKKDA